jgi:GAF domain-containing protein
LEERAGRSSNGFFVPAGHRNGVVRLWPMDRDLMARTVARLHAREPTFDWVGVYVVDGDALVLGPFEGLPTEHERIALGDGVCGSVATGGKTEVVPDVRLRPGHIACDIHTRSETVAPIVLDGRVLGVLDVDSNTPDAFGPREVALIEEAAKEIAAGA